MSGKIGVIADTVTDTAMGKAFFSSRRKNGALSGIENSLTESNSSIEVCGLSNLSVAVQIGAGLPPAQVVKQNG